VPEGVRRGPRCQKVSQGGSRCSKVAEGVVIRCPKVSKGLKESQDVRRCPKVLEGVPRRQNVF
jgi:hypothetical protein